jgi:hypothetical protein
MVDLHEHRVRDEQVASELGDQRSGQRLGRLADSTSVGE